MYLGGVVCVCVCVWAMDRVGGVGSGVGLGVSLWGLGFAGVEDASRRGHFQQSKNRFIACNRTENVEGLRVRYASHPSSKP